jgi:hypothetical protein
MARQGGDGDAEDDLALGVSLVTGRRRSARRAIPTHGGGR